MSDGNIVIPITVMLSDVTLGQAAKVGRKKFVWPPPAHPWAWQTSLAWCQTGCQVVAPEEWVVPTHGGPALLGVVSAVTPVE